MKLVRWLVGLATAVSIAACGGGGGGGGTTQLPTGSPTGFWLGSTGNGLELATLVLPDRTVWAFYAGIGSLGVVQGPLGGDARDFNVSWSFVTNAVVTAGANEKSTILGTISGSGGSTELSGTYQSAFESAPSLAGAAGTYTGTLSAGATFTLAASGAVNGSTPTCTFSGNATPRADANAFDISLTFAGGSCTLAGTSMNGIAVPNGASQLLVAAITAARTGAVVFVGNR